MSHYIVNFVSGIKRCMINTVLAAVFFPSFCFAENQFFSPKPPNQIKWRHSLSMANVELALTDTRVNFEQEAHSFRPEISLFTSDKQADNSLVDYQLVSKRKFNRYKNSIPTVYRLTLKGYSVVEYSNNQTDTWSLNKVKHRAFRKPEIMFSVTKSF